MQKDTVAKYLSGERQDKIDKLYRSISQLALSNNKYARISQIICGFIGVTLFSVAVSLVSIFTLFLDSNITDFTIYISVLLFIFAFLFFYVSVLPFYQKRTKK